MKRWNSALALLLLTAMLTAVWPACAQTRQAVVKHASVTVYEKPKTSSNVLGTLPKGTQVTVTAVQGRIAQISYAGKTGYVKKAALQLKKEEKKEEKKTAAATPVPAAQEVKPGAKTSAAAKSGVTEKTRRNTYAYREPSTSCKERTTVRKGTRFTILGSTGDFYKVERSGEKAYILKSAFQETAPAPAVSPTPTPVRTPVPTKAPETQPRTVLSDSKLYRRASRSAKVLDKVKVGSSVQVVREGRRFAQVYYQGTPGYLPLSAFKAAPQQTPAPAATATPIPSKPRNVNSEKAETVIAAALAQLGKPYVYGSTGPSSFDCSGLTHFSYKKAGVSLAHSAYSVGYGSGQKVTRGQLQRGDIVCFNTISDSDQCDHVGIYLGNNQFVHASSGQGRVVVSTLTGYYSDNFSWGRRVL